MYIYIALLNKCGCCIERCTSAHHPKHSATRALGADTWTKGQIRAWHRTHGKTSASLSSKPMRQFSCETVSQNAERTDTKPLFSANGRDARPVRPVHIKAAASLSGLRKPTGHAQANRQSRTPGRISSRLRDLARLLLVDHLSRDERSALRTLKQLLGMPGIWNPCVACSWWRWP